MAEGPGWWDAEARAPRRGVHGMDLLCMNGSETFHPSTGVLDSLVHSRTLPESLNRPVVTKNLTLKRATVFRLGQGLCQPAHIARPMVGSAEVQAVFPGKSEAGAPGTPAASFCHRYC